jgi:hypothetical protein
MRRRLSELFDLCESSWRALEAAGADDDVVRERRNIAMELAELLRDAGGVPVARRWKRGRWARALRRLLHGNPDDATAHESLRCDVALLRAYERAFDAGLPLELSSALLREYLTVKREQWRATDAPPLPERPHYAPILPSLREQRS